MSLDLSGLSAYIAQNEQPLIRKSLISSVTVSKVNKLLNVKNGQTINVMDGTITAQADTGGFTPTGSTSFKQVTAAVKPVTYQEDLNLKALNQMYTNQYLSAGSYNTEFSFNEFWTDFKTGLIAADIEKTVWQGNISTSSSIYDGFEKLIQSYTSPISGSVRVASGSAFTQSSSIAVFSAIYTGIPAQILQASDLVVFAGVDAVRSYKTAIVSANLYNYAGSQGLTDMTILGTGIPIIAVPGLNGTNHIYAGRSSNFYFTTDLLDEVAPPKFQAWFSLDFQTYRFNCELKAGTAIGIPAEVVYYIN